MKRAAIVLCLLLGSVGISGAQNDPLTMQHRLTAALRQINKLYEAGEYQTAMDRLKALQGEAAQDVNVLNMRGVILGKLGEHDQAKQVFQDIIAANPSFAPAIYNLGDMQFAQGDYEGALRSFDEISRNDPRNELVRFRIFLSHLALGHEEEAAKIAASMIPAGGTPAWYYAQAMLAKKREEPRLMKTHLTTAREIYGKEACRSFEEAITAVKVKAKDEI